MPPASQLAINTLANYSIEFHVTEIVPYVENRKRKGMCPMEELSLNKGPEEFYQAAKRYSHQI